MRRLRACLPLLVFGVFMPGAARAQQVHSARTGGVQFSIAGSDNALLSREYVSLTVFAGYGGTYRPGYWTPVDVIVHATVPADLKDTVGDVVRGTLRLTIQTGRAEQETHEAAVEVPVRGERRYSFLLLPEGDTVRVEFDPSREDWLRGQALGSGVEKVVGTLRLRPATGGAVLAATFSANERALRRVVGQPGTRRLDVVHLTASDALGTAPGWFGLDALVVTLREFGGLPPAVQDAMLQWVRSGGYLVLTYSGPYAHLSGEIAAALPARLSLSRQVVAGPELEALGEAALPEDGRTFVAVEQLDPRGEVLLETGGIPLVTRRALDSGTIVLVGADLAAPPFADWGGLSHVWALVLPDQPGSIVGGLGLLTELLKAFLGFRDISAAGLSSVLLAFAVYAALIGGVLAWGLRLADRAHIYWQVVGGIVLTMMIVAMANPAVLSRPHASVRTISLLHARSGAAVGRIETYAAGTSPVERGIDLSVGVGDGGFRVFPEERSLSADMRTQLVAYDGAPIARESVAGTRTVTVALGAMVAPSVPALEFVRLGQGRFRVRNRTGATLSNAGIAVRDGFVELHSLQPDSEVTVTLPGDSRYRVWAQFQAMKLFGGLLPGLLDVMPQAVDVPGALYPLMVTPEGVRAFGARATEPTLLAWWPLATTAADTAVPPALLQGHTLLVMRPEEP